MDDPKVFGLSKWKNGIAEMARTVGAAGVCGLRALPWVGLRC